MELTVLLCVASFGGPSRRGEGGFVSGIPRIFTWISCSFNLVLVRWSHLRGHFEDDEGGKVPSPGGLPGGDRYPAGRFFDA